MKCKIHPKYKAIYQPRKTNKFPDGCMECIKIFNKKHKVFLCTRNLSKNNNLLFKKGKHYQFICKQKVISHMPFSKSPYDYLIYIRNERGDYSFFSKDKNFPYFWIKDYFE